MPKNSSRRKGYKYEVMSKRPTNYGIQMKTTVRSSFCLSDWGKNNHVLDGVGDPSMSPWLPPEFACRHILDTPTSSCVFLPEGILWTQEYALSLHRSDGA